MSHRSGPWRSPTWITRAEHHGLLTEAQSEAFLAMPSGLGAKEYPARGDIALGDTRQLALRRGLPLATLGGDLRKAGSRAGVARYSPGV
ncbi:MAG: hypothetical protein JJT85_02605 [Chromatiales bacterium]|nr:hypothetical protein [Chromatiales bacterium]